MNILISDVETFWNAKFGKTRLAEDKRKKLAGRLRVRQYQNKRLLGKRSKKLSIAKKHTF